MTFAQPFKDYEILDRVGAGAMGTVFKARHKRLNRIVALKVLKPSLARDTRYVDRLRREARIVASLNHPYIVTGYDLGEEGGYHYFVMEFVEGKSLRALLVEWGMFAEEYVRRVARQVAMALDHAYQRGVIHRDIKPGNILIDEAGNVKLTDMGLAKGPADLTLTRDGATVGTPMYIAPEQARNPHDVDVRSDLYSLGATLYHMATGTPPFRGDTMAELITNVLSQTPQPPDEVNPALSEGLSLVIRKLLAKDLRVRYQNPHELLDDLDRIDRAQLPAVDEAKLQPRGAAPRWWLRVGSFVLVCSLLGGAWVLGSQMRETAEAVPNADEFLARLDADLAGLGSPGARVVHLRGVVDVPPNTGLALEQRRRAAMVELQAAVGAIVEELLGERWPELRAGLRDVAGWPDRERVEREIVQPALQQRAGMALGQLPASARPTRVDELLATVDRELAQRDAELVVRFEAFLATTLPQRVDDRRRVRDYAAAERLWRDALSTFCDGVRVPLVERLSGPLQQVLRSKALEAWQAAQPELDADENRLRSALSTEVATVCAGLRERLQGSVSPESVEEALQRFRADLAQVWPASHRFRVGRDPWPEVERQLGELHQDVQLATLQRDEQRFERRCDLAWRTWCHGRAADALALLTDDLAVLPRQVERLAAHRKALQAVVAVELALLQAIARSQQPTIGFRRGGGSEPLELRVTSEAGELRLSANLLGEEPRPMALSSLRLGELLTRLQRDRDPLQGLPGEVLLLGTTVARLVGDDLAGVGDLLLSIPAADRAFVADEVWPRVLRVREERPEVVVDRAALLVALREARRAAAKSLESTALESALLACAERLSPASRSPAEDAELREAEALRRLLRRRRDLLGELKSAAPDEASVELHLQGTDLSAEVDFGPAALYRDAAGWLLRDEAVQFVGASRPWNELALQRLRCSPGFGAEVARTRVVVDLVLPPASVGRRFYLFEHRGVGVLLFLGADDGVHLELVEGDVRKEEHVQRTFQRAVVDALGQKRTLMVPGAVHRLVIEVVASTSRDRGSVKVSFEGLEIGGPGVVLDPGRAPALTIHPQQEIAVRRVRLSATGL